MIAVLTAALAFSDTVTLATFDGTKTTKKWQDMNDPVSKCHKN